MSESFGTQIAVVGAARSPTTKDEPPATPVSNILLPDAVQEHTPAQQPEGQKQAVILVHGMGEQVPMGTLRGFVETMWVRDDGIIARRPWDPKKEGNPVWWKPDVRTGSPELSRITTRAGREAGETAAGPRTDFYELYWADLTEGNTLAQFRDWFRFLLWRRWRAVPPDVRSIWLILWAFTLTVGGLLVYRGLGALFPGLWPLTSWLDTAMKLGAIAYPAFIAWVLAYFGDVPRYTRAMPVNIAARRQIRERGLALLNAIEGQGGYGRIVLVGHSLGSILAYDLLKLLWSDREMIRTMRVGDARYQAVKAFQMAAGRLPATDDIQPADLEAYREAQFAVFKALKGATSADRPGWPISDLITVGSPLTHAQFLLEKDAPALVQGIAERRFPTNPPFMSKEEPLMYDLPGGTGAVRLHHAAPFAATRWSNIYDPSTAILLGDCISGPVSKALGRGTHDIPVTMRGKWSGRVFTHTLYWTDTGRGVSHLARLREALNLGRALH